MAGLGVLGLDGYSHLVLIASSDPLIVTLCLAAIDFHLSGRPKVAFVMLLLAALGRPEAWPFAGLYALWSWRAVPSMRILAVIGIVLIPAFWFIIPALTSKSWFMSGDLALRTVNPENVIHGSRILGVTNRFFDLTPLSLQIAALAGVVIAVLRRDKTVLVLAGATCLWVVVEIAMALHGWSGAERYVAEPAAVMVLIAAYAVGQALAFVPPRQRRAEVGRRRCDGAAGPRRGRGDAVHRARARANRTGRRRAGPIRRHADQAAAVGGGA